MSKWIHAVVAKMKPTLFYDDRSPPVRSCLLLIKNLGVDIDLKFIDLFKQDHLKSDYIKINPFHTVPTLSDGDLVLTDSHSIMIYLCEKYGKKTDLYPCDATLKIKVINKLFFECSVLFRRDSDMMSDLFRGEVEHLDRRKDKVKEAFSVMESFLKEHKFMACDHITIADFSIVTTLSTVNILVPLEESKWPLLAKWFEEMKSIPYFKEINEIGINKLKDALINIAKIDIPIKLS